MRLFFVTLIYLVAAQAAQATQVLRDTDKIHLSFREIVNRNPAPLTVAVQMEFCAGVQNDNGGISGEMQCEILARSNSTSIGGRPSDKTFINSMPATDSNRTEGKKVNELADTLRARLKGDQSKAVYRIVVTMWEMGNSGFVLSDRQFSPLPDLSTEPDYTQTLVDKHVLVSGDKHLQTRVLIVVGRKQ